jgi:hypothetical protein
MQASNPVHTWYRTAVITLPRIEKITERRLPIVQTTIRLSVILVLLISSTRIELELFMKKEYENNV